MRAKLIINYEPARAQYKVLYLQLVCAVLYMHNMLYVCDFTAFVNLVRNRVILDEMASLHTYFDSQTSSADAQLQGK